MKFLCVPCDKPMKLLEAQPPERGAVSLIYSCSDCGYEFAMLTNPMETQVVGSLGVQLGGEAKCPFTGMVQEMPVDSAKPGASFPWTAQAQQRLESIPSFVRPMAKTGIEKFARDNGHDEVDEAVLAQARSHFGM